MPKKRARTEGVPDHELTIWSRRFATMVDSGVSLMHAMDLLAQEETTPSLRAVTRDLMAKVEAGATLSQAMGDWPQVFGEHYIGLAIFGEIGGILDVALRRVAERMEAGRLVQGWEESRPLTRADLAEWCWQFAQMLKAGVPLLPAITTLSRTAHPVLRRISREVAAEVEAGGSIAPDREGVPPEQLPAIWRYPGIFTPTVRELIGFGIWFGPLDQHLLRVAELLDHEARLEREGKLRPLPTEGIDTRKVPPAEREVATRVNDLLKAAIDKDAQWVMTAPTGEGVGHATLMSPGGVEVLATIALTRYEQMVRRIRIMADIDPFAHEERRSQIHLGYQGKEYLILVRSQPAAGGGRLELRFGEDEKAVRL